MPRKRLIFTLLYDSGNFMLSRNFRLQKVGDLRWLTTNYDFSRISHSIDELIVLDVSRNERDLDRFSDTLKQLVQHVFVPVAAGGGIDTPGKGARLLNSGADKLVVNSILHSDPALIAEMAKRYGRQCMVVSIDFRNEQEGYAVYYDRGGIRSEHSLAASVTLALEQGAGEIYLNSMDRDGTGNGYVMEVIDMVGAQLQIPLIMAGGAGNARHLVEGAKNPAVDAVATANLFNFIGDGLPLARQGMIEAGIDLARWNSLDFNVLQNVCGPRSNG
jgi:cyclase